MTSGVCGGTEQSMTAKGFRMSAAARDRDGDLHGHGRLRKRDDPKYTVIDDFAPSCPAIDLTDGGDTRLSNSDNITSDDTPTVHVVAHGIRHWNPEAGDIVELYIWCTVPTHTVTQTLWTMDTLSSRPVRSPVAP